MSGKKIARKYTEKGNREIGKFPYKFVNKIFFNKEKQMIETPIVSIRIIYNILSILNNSQFHAVENPHQLELFDNEYFKDINTYAQITISNNAVNPGRNQNELKKGLEYLSNIKEWVEYTNTKGEKLTAQKSFIIEPIYSRGKTTFLMSNFWLYDLLEISGFNQILGKLIFQTNNDKLIIFHTWIIQLKEVGTEIGIEKFKEKFKLNYKKIHELKRSFLDPAREKFDQLGLWSFQYRIEGKFIYFKKYGVKQIDKENIESPKIKLQSEIRRKKSYLKTRHNISEENFNSLEIALNYHFNWIMKAYDLFILNCREQKIKATDIVDIEFLKQLQNQVIKVWNDSIQGKNYPKAYPRVL